MDLMHAKVFTCAVVGLDGVLVEVEVDIPSQGLANFLNVGVQYCLGRLESKLVRSTVGRRR